MHHVFQVFAIPLKSGILGHCQFTQGPDCGLPTKSHVTNSWVVQVVFSSVCLMLIQVWWSNYEVDYQGLG